MLYEGNVLWELTWDGSLHPGPAVADAPQKAGWIRVAAAPGTYRDSLGCSTCLEITGTGSESGNSPIVGKR